MTDKLPEKVTKARIQLMLGEPFLSSSVARFPVVDATQKEWCDTMCTDGYTIFINSEFCDKLDLDEVCFVFAHEVAHCMFGHIDRRGNRNPEIWNYAIDYATNLLLVDFGLKMPKVGLFDRKYIGMTAEDIYDLLVSKDAANQKGLGEKGGVVEVAVDGFGSGSKTGHSGEPFDLHLEPEDPRAASAREEEMPSKDERQRLRKQIMIQSASKLRGTVAGNFQSEIQMAKGGKIPWQALLSQFFSGLRRDNYRMLPPNKKHLWRGIYLPTMGVPGPDHIVVAVDTSGSMSDDELSKILKEIDRLRSTTQCGMTVMQCDAEIQSIKSYEEWDEPDFNRTRFIGRGGTSFLPVFNWIADQQRTKGMNLDCLFFMTDGYGNFPAEPPPYPVAWIVTENFMKDIPFGEIIEL